MHVNIIAFLLQAKKGLDFLLQAKKGLDKRQIKIPGV